MFVILGVLVIALVVTVYAFSGREAASTGRALDPSSGSGAAPWGGGEARLSADKRFVSQHSLMTHGEASFLGVLALIVPKDFYIFSKVRMADVIQPSQNGWEGKRSFNEIGQKHLDFVICRRGTWKFVCAVELDDRTHRRASRVVRDTFVDIVLSGAGIPLVRVPAQAEYSVEELRQSFSAVFGAESKGGNE